MLISQYAAYLLECAARNGDRKLTTPYYLSLIDGPAPRAQLASEMLPDTAGDDSGPALLATLQVHKRAAAVTEVRDLLAREDITDAQYERATGLMRTWKIRAVDLNGAA
jgi:hypothetical protein